MSDRPTTSSNAEANPTGGGADARYARYFRPGFVLSGIVVLAFVALLVAGAFAPDWMGTPLSATVPVSIGVVLTLGLIFFSIVLAVAYMWVVQPRLERIGHALTGDQVP